jgi:hypothetical protein
VARRRRLSPRQHAQRVQQRKTGSRGFDRGGNRRSIFRSKYAKIFYVVGVVGIVGSLVPILLLGNDSNPNGGSTSAADRGAASGPAPVSMLDGPEDDAVTATVADVDQGAVEDKPQFDAPPAVTIDPESSYTVVMTLEDGSVIEIELFADVTKKSGGTLKPSASRGRASFQWRGGRWALHHRSSSSR